MLLDKFKDVAHRPVVNRIKILPYRDAFRLQIIPSGVHFVESTLQHDRIFLRGKGAQQLPSGTVQAVINDSM